MVTPLCFATPNDIEKLHFKRKNDSLSSNFALDRHSCKLALRPILRSLAVILIRDESPFTTVIIRH